MTIVDDPSHIARRRKDASFALLLFSASCLKTRKLTCMRFIIADELAALDTANIISGPRTRGKKIDFRKASEEAGGDDEDVRLFPPSRVSPLTIVASFADTVFSTLL